MKIVALPDLHGRIDYIDTIGGVLAGVDMVLLPGDLTNGSLGQLEKVLDAVSAHNTNILAVPGNMDTQPIDKRLIEQGINIHTSSCTIDNVTFMGVGGALPFYGRFVFEEPELAELLKQSAADVDPNTAPILVCHQPPVNTLNDLVRGKHVGSQSVRTFIEQRQPLICFTGHIHEAIGVDTIGKTHIINPGRLWHNKTYAYAEVDASRCEVVTVEVGQV